MFEWFFIVKHSSRDGTGGPNETKAAKAELLYSCWDDKLAAEQLARAKSLAVEMTMPFVQLKNVHPKQLEVFYFDNGDGDDTLHLTCLLHCQTLQVYGFIGRIAAYGELREILIAIWRLNLDDYAPIASLLEEILAFCGHNSIAIYSFQSNLYPAFNVEAKKNRLEDKALAELFSRLEPENVVEIFCAMLLESTIIVSSSRLDWISSCMLLLDKLFQPFKWQRIKVPLLSPSMVHVCSAPIPAIIGVHSSLLKEAIHQVVDENLGNAPNKDDTGFYLLINADAQHKNSRLRRLDQMPLIQVSASFTSTYVSALRNNWKTLLKKLSNGDMSTEEFVRLVYTNCHTFIAHLILGYDSCFSSTLLQTSLEQKHRSESGFDTDKFVQLGASKSSLQQTRQLLSNCQYFEQFVASRNFDVSSSERSKSVEPAEYRQFDLVYNHVMKTEGDRIRPSSNVSKLGQQFHSKVDTAYSRISGQTLKLQSEMRSRTTKMKDMVRTKVPEGPSVHKSSVFYLTSPVIITRTSRSVSAVNRGRNSHLDGTQSSREDKAIRRKTDNSADSRNIHRRTAQKPNKEMCADLLNLSSQPNLDDAASISNSAGPPNRDHSKSKHRTSEAASLANERLTSINLIDFDTVATTHATPDPPMSFTSNSLFEEFDNLFVMESSQSARNGTDSKDGGGEDNSNSLDFRMDEELCSLFSNWVPSENEVRPPRANGEPYSKRGDSSDISGSSNLIQFSANNPFNF